MIKFVFVFLLLEMFVAAAQGDDPCCYDIENSQEGLKSAVKALQDLNRDLRTRLERLENVKPSTPPTVEQRKVAFFAGMTKDLGPANTGTVIVFDNIVTNIGSAYSSSTGRFTAPVIAAYQFSFTIGALHSTLASVVLVKNGVTIMELWSDSNPHWAPSSEEVILSLKAGDQVWVQTHKVGSKFHGRMQTTFSGFLIFENRV